MSEEEGESEEGSGRGRGREESKEEEESEEWNGSCVYVCGGSGWNAENGSECGSENIPCGSIKEGIESKGYKREGFDGWIVLMGGEHGKENGSIIGEERDIKIRGEGDGGGGGGGEGVVKLVGGIEGGGEGILYGSDVGLSLEGIRMKEIEGDEMNVPLIVWRGGYVNMSGVEIIRIGGGGLSDVVMEVSGSRLSEMSECIIRYEWKNKNSSLRERYEKNEEGENMCEWNESVIVLKNNVKFVMKRCEVNGSRSGGISVNGGDVNMSECIFEGTYEEKEGFESVMHNIKCSNEGNIVMNGYNGESITKNTSLWICNTDCTFSVNSSEETLPPSLFFVPTLSHVRYDNATVTLTFIGELLIPCSLYYQIFFKNGSAYVQSKQEVKNYVNEGMAHTISVVPLRETEEFAVRLIFGDGESKTDMVSVVRDGGGSGSGSEGGREEGEGGESRGSVESEEKKEDETQSEEKSGEGEREGEEGGERRTSEGEGKGRRMSTVMIGVVVGIATLMMSIVVCICVCGWNRKRGKTERRGGGEMMEVTDSLLSYEDEGEEMEWKDGMSTIVYTVDGKKRGLSSDVQVLVQD